MIAGVDYIGVGVGTAIFNEDGKFLIGLRGEKCKNERGKWQIPGGALDFGETFEQAAKREAFEEHGIEVEVLDLLGIIDHIIPDEKQHWVTPTYICKIKKGKPQILEPEKCAKLGWFTIEEAKNLPLSIATTESVKMLDKKFPNGVDIKKFKS